VALGGLAETEGRIKGQAAEGAEEVLNGSGLAVYGLLGLMKNMWACVGPCKLGRRPLQQCQ
jgi:hypothetical protein